MYSSITASSYPFLSFCFSDDGGGGCGLLSLIKKSLFCTLDITSSSSSWRPRRRFCGGTSTRTSSVLSTKVLKHELRPAEEKSRDLVEGKISFIGTKYISIRSPRPRVSTNPHYLSNEELLVHSLRANQIERFIAVPATSSSSSLTVVVPLPISCPSSLTRRVLRSMCCRAV